MALVASAALLGPRLSAAMADVVVWDGVRSTTDLANTCQNGYFGTPAKRLWWRFDGTNVGYDASGNTRHGTVKGVVTGLTMPGPLGGNRIVATGFNDASSYVVGNPGFTNGATHTRTYEMWVRNPAKNNSVFFSILRSATGQVAGGQPSDIMRMWVNADGSLTVADRGTALQMFTSGALAWDTDKWYQISIIYDVSGTTHDVRVYRAERNVAFPSSPLFNYTSGNVGTEHWLAVGGHERSYQTAERDDTGMEGFLGCDGPPGADPIITPETYGANGFNSNDDTEAWHKACAVLSAWGRGTLRLTAGATYLVGYELPNDGISTNAYWISKYGEVGNGRITGATGAIVVEGNGATVKLNAGMHFGAFKPTDGTKHTTQTLDPLYKAEPGDLLLLIGCTDVEVKDVTFDGNIQQQVWGGWFSGDQGIQVDQSGIKVEKCLKVWIHDVTASYNGKDGLNIYNLVTETDPRHEVKIERAICKYNGRQGLSYNCGNHLEVYDSEFSHTAKISGKANTPGAGADVERMGRYMREGVLFDNCTFYDNTAAGLLIVGSNGVIARDCTFWGTTTYGIKIEDAPAYAADYDHHFLRSKIYGGVYSNNGERIRFEICDFYQHLTGNSSSIHPGAAIAKRHGIEQVGGSLVISDCNFEALQGAQTGVDPATIKANSVYLTKAVVRYSDFLHGNWKGAGNYSACTFGASYVAQNVFDETTVWVSKPDRYYISAGSVMLGAGNTLLGSGASPSRYLSWNTSTASRPFPDTTLTSGVVPADVVLTGNPTGGEPSSSVGATYTTGPEPFNNPADGSNTRLFNGDVNNNWNDTAGLNWEDTTVTIDLNGAARKVRMVKIRFAHTQKPLRVRVYAGASVSTRVPMGLIQPSAYPSTQDWFEVIVPTPITAGKVWIEFENEGGWGWYINEVKVYGTPN